ncbi:hypothetical protein RHGRI_005398 [Rhododendron griersonianum]|uniref:Uncharacterized protein n=1 Tax=Rhododendron griersonianum TaxID=479676 RepID=A0AAV6LC53_9ERIC|nr:hypothetical protein RHGRI_005398 [Rhododendron griersonianum]KAG5562660.1 hypothetical protein RHGRI_005398 [Rhododendron griersonianum]
MMYLLSKLLKITVQNLRLRFGGPLVVSDLDGFEVLEDSTMQRLLCTSEDFGVPQCPHYRRRCRIRAPCCNEIFDCRHCHNEAKNGINVDQKHRHDIPRHLVQQVICSLCGTEQEVSHDLVWFGKSVSVVACVWEDTSVRLASCLMTIYQRSSIIAMDVAYAGLAGGRISSIAINAVRCCYSVLLKNCHPCVEGAMHHDCPVCFEKTAVQYLFESRNDVIVMPCGHTIHKSCLKEMQEHYQYACPLCSKSVCDMSKVWEKFDVEIAATPMPELYQNKMVWILCNDCGSTSEVQFHIVGQKCPNCKSYNTRQTR